VAVDAESKALVEPENDKNATIIEMRSPGFKNEAKLHKGSALKQVSTFLYAVTRYSLTNMAQLKTFSDNLQVQFFVLFTDIPSCLHIFFTVRNKCRSWRRN
jgi:hypothetical protein